MNWEKLVTLLSVILVDFGENIVTGIGRVVKAYKEIEALKKETTFSKRFTLKKAETREQQWGK